MQYLQDLPHSLQLIVILFVMGVCAYILYMLLSRCVGKAIDKIIRLTDFKWDDIIFRKSFMRWVWILVTLLPLKSFAPLILKVKDFPTASIAVNLSLEVMLILVIMMLVIEIIKSAFVLIAERDNVDDIATQLRMAEDNGEKYHHVSSHSLKGLQQMLIVIVVGVSAILVISLLFGKNPIIVFSGLGACAAVLMLIFQDSILGVVAGVQLTVNNMLKPGDWIVASAYDINGIVEEVTLATVKVRNWDHTIVTVPPYSLIKGSFQNWKGMIESGGRRIARSINVDMTKIRYATPQELDRWRQQPWWSDELGERPVNLTVFRRYIEHYISTEPTFIEDMIYMVREMDPTPQGLPVQIYFFTSSTQWKKYEMIQARVFDNVLANISEFGLSVFQYPTSIAMDCYPKENLK